MRVVVFGLNSSFFPHLLDQFFVPCLVSFRVELVLESLHDVEDFSVDTVVDLQRLTASRRCHFCALAVDNVELVVQLEDRLCILDGGLGIQALLPVAEAVPRVTRAAHLLHFDLQGLRCHSVANLGKFD